MTTLFLPAIDPAFEMTQAEADACEYVLREPYRKGYDIALPAKVGVFLTYYRETRQTVHPSSDVTELFMQCFLDGDYSYLDAILPTQRSIVEQMFARAKFRCETADV